MNSSQKQFLCLLRLAISSEKDKTVEASHIDWEAVYKEAKLQSVVGIVFSGIEQNGKITAHQNMPNRNLLMNWLGQTELIKAQHKIHVEVIRKVNSLLNDAKICHVFMKGLTCGARYPHPELRSCGDIDFVVASADFRRTLDALNRIANVNRDLAHEHHGMAHLNGVTLEPHFKVHNYQNPLNDREMKRMFAEVFPGGLSSVEIGGNRVPIFPMEFEGMFLVSHMVNHVYEEGLGLRQVMDFALWLNNLPSSNMNIEKYFEFLDRMNMTRSARIFTRICEQYLGVDCAFIGYEYTGKEIAFADKMMEDILSVGNFGRGTEYGKVGGFIGSIKNYMIITKRCIRLSYLCPSEAYWWPLSKLTRFWGKKIGLFGAR